MNILVIIGSGIGGTEKAAFLFAEELIRRGHHVVALSDPNHPRTQAFLNAGGIVEATAYTTKTLLDLIKKHRIDVIHQHVSGYGDHRELYAALDQLGESCPRLIETNVFGQLRDFHDRDHVDMRMFISLTSGVQAFRRTRVIPTPNIRKDTVLFYPRDPSEGSERIDRYQFRKSLGIAPNEFLSVRVGRPGHKWARWECEAFAWARRRNPSLRLFLMEPNPEIAMEVQRGDYGEGIIVRPATSDFRFVSGLYQASDLMIHASSFGESFGYTLAEAMIAGLPIITRATPWGDNAQTELVSHGNTGYVCGSVRGMATALLELSQNPHRCHEMGIAARERIDSMFPLERETDLLEEILHYVTGGSMGTLMNERYKAWKEYARDGHFAASRKRYEADHCLPISHLSARLYEAMRCANSLKMYYKLRSQGRAVVPPSLLH